jgi:Chlorophyllase
MKLKLRRREFIGSMLAAGAMSPALLSLPGCGLEYTCPEDPADSAGVDWTPDILHPVFWGFQELGTAEGAPGTLRVYYPSADGSPQNARILKLCLVRYPVVMFLHGQPPCLSDPTYFRRWTRLPMVLARSGYVVVVPKHDAALPEGPQSPAIDFALAVLNWVRTQWEHSRWVDQDPTATAIAGHSLGALLAARVRAADPRIGSYASFGAGWTEITGFASLLQSIDVPSFFWWGTQAAGAENMDVGGLWQMVGSQRKSKAIYDGKHFDYLPDIPGCSFERGSCSLIEALSAELVALFFQRHVPVKLSHAPIPPNLVPPAVTLTPTQQFFAGSHLSAIEAIRTRQGCSVDLHWEEPDETGSRHLGP